MTIWPDIVPFSVLQTLDRVRMPRRLLSRMLTKFSVGTRNVIDCLLLRAEGRNYAGVGVFTPVVDSYDAEMFHASSVRSGTRTLNSTFLSNLILIGGV
jgi:hypothetical protein